MHPRSSARIRGKISAPSGGRLHAIPGEGNCPPLSFYSSSSYELIRKGKLIWMMTLRCSYIALLCTEPWGHLSAVMAVTVQADNKKKK